jgi:hypothetical protein
MNEIKREVGEELDQEITPEPMPPLIITRQEYEIVDEKEGINRRNQMIQDLNQANEKATPSGQILLNQWEKNLLSQDQTSNIDQAYVWDKLPLSQRQKEELVYAAIEANMRKEVLNQIIKSKHSLLGIKD